MRRNTVLAVLTAIGSATCWWPVINEPSLDLAFWRPPLSLVLVALGTGLATVLSDRGWAGVVKASIGGTVVGLCLGFWIWWPSDRISASFVPLGVAAATVASCGSRTRRGFCLEEVFRVESRAPSCHLGRVALLCCIGAGCGRADSTAGRAQGGEERSIDRREVRGAKERSATIPGRGRRSGAEMRRSGSEAALLGTALQREQLALYLRERK